MICAGGLAIASAYRQANNCAHFSSVNAFVFSYADYSLCLFYSVLLSTQGKFNLKAILVSSFVSTSIFLFVLFLPLGVGREDLLVSAGKENITNVIFLLFLLLSCTEMGSKMMM